MLQGEGGTVNALFSPCRLAHRHPRRPRRADRPGHRQPQRDARPARHRATSSCPRSSATCSGSSAGCPQDRDAIGSSLVSIDRADRHDRVAAARRPGPTSRTTSRSSASSRPELDEPASRKLLEHFLTYTPFKLKVSTPEASYGAFLNFYVCAANFILPDGTETPCSQPLRCNDTKRCTRMRSPEIRRSAMTRCPSASTFVVLIAAARCTCRSTSASSRSSRGTDYKRRVQRGRRAAQRRQGAWSAASPSARCRRSRSRHARPGQLHHQGRRRAPRDADTGRASRSSPCSATSTSPSSPQGDGQLAARHGAAAEPDHLAVRRRAGASRT